MTTEQSELSKKAPFNIPALDGLRALACCAVVCSHGLSKILGYYPVQPVLPVVGAFGVMLFFVLSGFLLSVLYFPIQWGGFSWRYWFSFLIRRFFRIYPLYAVLCLFTWWTGTHALSEVWTSGFDLSYLYRRVFLIDGNRFWWTIPVEVRFYLLFPLVVTLSMAAERRSISMRIFWVFSIWVVLLFLSQDYRFSIHYSPPWTIRNFFIGLTPFFIGGVLLGYIYKTYYYQLKKYELGWTSISLICLFVLLCGLIPFTAKWFISDKNLWLNSNRPFLLIVLLVFSCTLSHHRSMIALTNPLMRFLAQISYGLFLIHPSVFNMNPKLVLTPSLQYLATTPQWQGMVFRIFFFLGSSVLLAIFFYFTIERPGIRLGRFFSRLYD